MKIDQGDILYGTSMIFIKEYMHLAERQIHKAGEYVCNAGDPARYFYTLLEGSVRLNIYESVKQVYVVKKPGEAFGWSSIVGRESYSASVECMEDTTLLRIDREKLAVLLEKYPECGHIFYRKLAEILGNRLLECYNLISQISG